MESPEWNNAAYKEEKQKWEEKSYCFAQGPRIFSPVSNIKEEWEHERKKGAHIGSKKQNKKNRIELK